VAESRQRWYWFSCCGCARRAEIANECVNKNEWAAMF
jgi:hypothetical protein